MVDIKSLTLPELQEEMEKLGRKLTGQSRSMDGCMRNWRIVSKG